MTAQVSTVMQPVVSVSNLRVRFVGRHISTLNAVNGITFELGKGEVLGILGESGSGKTVTLRALMGLLPPKRTRIEGRIIVAGSDIVDADETTLRDIRGTKIAMVFQEPMIAFDPVFTIGVQIAETIIRHESLSSRAAYARARELLEMVQIPSATQRLKAYPHELSGGMRQRAMIALALSCRPQVLLADEPTSALDVSVQIQLILLLRSLQKELGMSVIFVTHDIGVAVEISDRLAVMYAGRFVELGDVEAVVRSPAHPYSAGLLASSVAGAVRGHRLDAIFGLPPDLSDMPPGCSFEPRCRYSIERCRVSVPPLTSQRPGHLTRCVRVAEHEIALVSPLLGPRL